MYQNKESFNILEFLNNKIKELKDAGINNAQKELEWLLNENFSIPKETLLLKKSFLLNSKQLQEFSSNIKRRKKKEPLQYIMNSAPFYGLDLFVNKNVFIPRPETEIIINVLKKKNFIFKHALDIGTGSGNLALLLSIEKISLHITAIDISSKALTIAKKNFTKYNTRNIKFFKHDFLSKKLQKKYDLVVCNPPYISLLDYKQLSKTVKNFEPKNSLTDNKDGLKFYKQLASSLEDLLNPGGVMLLEIGLENTKKTIHNLFKNKKRTWHKDLQNQDRILEIIR